MDTKLILVLLMGLIGLGYAIPRVRRDVMEAVPINSAMGDFAIDPSAEKLEGAEQRYGSYGGYGDGGYGGYGGNGGGYGSGGYGGYGSGGYGGYGGGQRHHHYHQGGYYG